jgi:hypothetical protein
LIKFDRYVAINSPVRLLYGISKLDEYFQAPLVRSDGERAANIENTFLKVAALSKSSLTPQSSMPFSGIESKFLIGVAFQLILNQNDLLLPEGDLAWLKTTFPGDQLTVFEQGRHLGNLSHPTVQKAILDALDGLWVPLRGASRARTDTQ